MTYRMTKIEIIENNKKMEIDYSTSNYPIFQLEIMFLELDFIKVIMLLNFISGDKKGLPWYKLIIGG